MVPGMSNGKNEINFKPLWDYVLLDPIRVEKSKGGLHLPETGKGLDDTAKGLCIKAGPGAYRDNGTFVPNPIKVGDVVFHMASRMPFKVRINGHDYLCISGRDCVAIEGSEKDSNVELAG